jgi:hypothetical protein
VQRLKHAQPALARLQLLGTRQQQAEVPLFSESMIGSAQKAYQLP